MEVRNFAVLSKQKCKETTIYKTQTTLTGVYVTIIIKHKQHLHVTIIIKHKFVFYDYGHINTCKYCLCFMIMVT
jgi:hypothetical protein